MLKQLAGLLLASVFALSVLSLPHWLGSADAERPPALVKR